MAERGTLIICNHLAGRLEYDGHLAGAARDAFGVSTLALTHGAASVRRALAAGFDEAIDLSHPDDGDQAPRAEELAALAALERRTAGRSLREDILQDRWLANRFSMNWSLRYLASVQRTMDAVLATHDVVAAVGEVNYAAYRLVRRMLQERDVPYLLAAWARAYDRFYLDPSFYSVHERCVRAYEGFRAGAIPEDARRAAEQAIHRIAGEKRGPNYQEAAVGAAPAPGAGKFWRVLSRAAGSPAGSGHPAAPRAREHGLAASIARGWNSRAGRRTYADLVAPTPAKGQYALYLLHTAPEYQINTCGWPFRDEAFLVARIAESLPVGMTLLVKEHQLMLGRRDAEAYRRMAGVPSVRIASATANARELIDGAAMVFTISGNGAVEALACRKPVIVFSPVFYTHFEGITRCRDLLQLPEMIHERLSAPPIAAELVTAAFAAMYVASRPGIPFKPNGRWSEPDNLALLRRGFAEELEELVGLQRPMVAAGGASA